jgi:hypothetical protein
MRGFWRGTVIYRGTVLYSEMREKLPPQPDLPPADALAEFDVNGDKVLCVQETLEAAPAPATYQEARGP